MPADTNVLAGKIALVLENEPFIAMEIEEILTAHGCRVILATKVEQAWLALKECSPHMAFLDFGELKDSNDPCFVQHLFSLEIPYVFVTGERRVDVEDTYHQGVHVIEKPFGQDAIVSAGRRML